MYLAQLLILASVLIEISLTSLGYFVVLYPPQKNSSESHMSY